MHLATCEIKCPHLLIFLRQKENMQKTAKVHEFYSQMVKEFIPSPQASILVCGGGTSDINVFSNISYSNVYFSGMDQRNSIHKTNTPKLENAEFLSFPDNSFDYAVMHAAVHHCSLPHKVLTELYRVSRIGFLVIESRDSLLIRIANTLGLSEQYEVSGNFAGHGVNGTDIPNFIYRWTEREVEKTIKAFAPHFNHSISYRYGSIYPDSRDLKSHFRSAAQLLHPFYRLITILAPKQQNHFAFFVRKPEIPRDLKPWLKLTSDGQISVDRDWISTRYTKRLSR
jgi:ubiquinone/menaquinone biosynthesis C-methylase UbiE